MQYLAQMHAWSLWCHLFLTAPNGILIPVPSKNATTRSTRQGRHQLFFKMIFPNSATPDGQKTLLTFPTVWSLTWARFTLGFESLVSSRGSGVVVQSRTWKCWLEKDLTKKPRKIWTITLANVNGLQRFAFPGLVLPGIRFLHIIATSAWDRDQYAALPKVYVYARLMPSLVSCTKWKINSCS